MMELSKGKNRRTVICFFAGGLLLCAAVIILAYAKEMHNLGARALSMAVASAGGVCGFIALLRFLLKLDDLGPCPSYLSPMDKEFRTLKRGDRRTIGYQVRPHGDTTWEGGSRRLLGRRLRKRNLDYAEFRAPVRVRQHLPYRILLRTLSP